MKRITVITFMSFLWTIMYAQQFITTSLKLPAQKMSVFMINDNSIPSEGATVSFKWICFDNDIRTAIIHIEWPFFLNEYKKGKPNTKVLEFSYSGKELHLIKKKEGGASYYMVSRGKTPCAMIADAPINGSMQHIAQIRYGDDCYPIDDVYLGMNIDELKELTSQSMRGSKVEFVGKDGNQKVYRLMWLGERFKYKDLNGTNHSELGSNTEYGRFWFDERGKLTKWYSFLEGSGM